MCDVTCIEWSAASANEINALELLSQSDFSVMSNVHSSAVGNYELMQFTGLLDKQGKEIYEGDVVMRDNNAHPHIVGWDKDGYWLRNAVATVGIEGIDEKHCVVIGNIYENPDLIKEANSNE
jgi:hypothetical protein